MNLPNRITLIRVLMIPVFMFFAMPLPDWLITGQLHDFITQYGNYIAAVIFVVAASTDVIDGHIARTRKLITDFGKFIDPVADKLLVTSALIALVQRDELTGWAAMLIIGRELIITGLRLVAAGEGVVLAAGSLGKLKTITQIIAITAMLINNFPLSMITAFPFDDYFMIIAVILTIISGVDYLVKNVHLIRVRR